jgi:hypothetical protein
VTTDTDETPLDKLYRYAADLILKNATEIEYLTIGEVAEDHGFPHGINDAEQDLVDDLISKATVRVSWPDHEYIYGNTFEDDTDGDEGSANK